MIKSLFRKPHPSIKPGQPFFYLGRPMRVVSASTQTATAHYADNSGAIRTVRIPSPIVKDALDAISGESRLDEHPDKASSDDDPRFVELT